MRKRFTYKEVLFITLFVLWEWLIFYMSSKPADESMEMSEGVKLFLGLDFSWASWFVRKLAHIGEYTILALLAALVICSVPVPCFNRHNLPIVFFVTFITACSDEWHQTFVPGRSGVFGDVLVDMIGFVISFVVARVVGSMPMRKYKSTATEDDPE